MRYHHRMLQRFAALFRQERPFWTLCTVVLGTIAVLRGCDRPNTWIITQAQITYSQGFVKRALFGELLTRPLHLYTSGRYTVISYLFMAVALVLLILFTQRSGVRQRLGNGEVAALFFSSYTLTYFVSDVGYFDALLLILTVPLLLIRSPTIRFLVALPFSALALLLHEMFLIAFLPIVLFSFLLTYQTEETHQGKRRTVVFGAALTFVDLAITFLIALQPTLSATKVAALEASVRTQARFPVRHDFFVVLNRSFADNLHLMVTSFYSDPDWWISQVASIFFFAPLVLLLWLAIRRILAVAGFGHTRLLRWSAAAASLAPLSLHLMGFDSVRWNCLVGLSTYLVLLTLCRHLPGPAVPPTNGFRNACVLAIALALSSSGSLIAGHLYSYPFVNDQGFFYGIRALFHGKDATPKAP